MNEDLVRKLVRARIQSPNNATAIFISLLQDAGVEVTVKGKRAIAHINNKSYAISITSHNKYVLDCRQYENGLDGLLSLWEANGQIYLVEDVLLNKGSKTRELSKKEYITVKSKESIQYLTPTTFISQIPTESYKDMYIKEAQVIADELVKDCTQRMLNRY